MWFKDPKVKKVEQKDLEPGHLEDFAGLLLVELHRALACLHTSHYQRKTQSYFVAQFLLLQVSVIQFLMKTEAFLTVLPTRSYI